MPTSYNDDIYAIGPATSSVSDISIKELELDGFLTGSLSDRQYQALLDMFGTSLVINPSFEVDANSWANYSNTNLARVTTQFQKGIASLEVSAQAAGGIFVGSSPLGLDAPPVVPGVEYRCQAYFRAEVTSRQAIAGIRWTDAAGAFIVNSLGTPVITSNSEWTKATVIAVAPANAANATVRLQAADNAVLGEKHYVDSVVFERTKLSLSDLQVSRLGKVKEVVNPLLLV